MPSAPLLRYGVSSVLEVLRNTSYAKLFSAQVVALLGTGLLTIALGLLASAFPRGLGPYPTVPPMPWWDGFTGPARWPEWIFKFYMCSE